MDKTGPLSIPDTNWVLTTVTKSGLQLTSGRHVLRIVADTNAGNGIMGDIDYLRFTPSSEGAGQGLTADYYDNANFTSYKLTRTDASVNFDWGTGSPAPSVGAEEFSVRWSGTVVPRYSETYAFHTTTDDGVRLWVDGQLIIDKWMDQGPTEWGSTPITLAAGRQYSIRMEFYDHSGGASAKLSWSSQSQLKEIVPQSQLYPAGKARGSSSTTSIKGRSRARPTSARPRTGRTSSRRRKARRSSSSKLKAWAAPFSSPPSTRRGAARTSSTSKTSTGVTCSAARHGRR